MPDQKEAGGRNCGLVETCLIAIISKTVNRSVTCQGALKISSKGAFQKCKVCGNCPPEAFPVRLNVLRFWLFFKYSRL